MLNRYTALKLYPGFKSLPLRQNSNDPEQRIGVALVGDSMWYVYIIQCRDGSLYTGITNDLAKRLDAHNAGLGAKYTRSRLPVLLVHSERFRAKGRALSREMAIKGFDRKRKLALIA